MDDLEAIEDVIVELLAGEVGQDVVEYRAELAEGGSSLPCDSVMAVEIMVKVEARYGIQLQLNAETARAMRSVQTYAALVSACCAAAALPTPATGVRV